MTQNLLHILKTDFIHHVQQVFHLTKKSKPGFFILHQRDLLPFVSFESKLVRVGWLIVTAMFMLSSLLIKYWKRRWRGLSSKHALLHLF